MVDSDKKHWRTALVALAIGLATILIYWPAQYCDFVQYDDDQYVFNNPNVFSGLTTEGLVWSVADVHSANWHPVTWVSHMLDCQLFGLNAGWHHLVNLLFHVANSVLLFFVFRAMTGAFWRSAFVAAMFAWHPLRVESVAWISERKDVLSAFFFMLTLWAYVAYARRKEGIPAVNERSASAREATPAQFFGRGIAVGRRLWASPSFFHGLCLGLFLLGLLSKPMLVSVPIILLAIDIWPLNRAPLQAGGMARWRELLREKVPFFLMAVAVGLITILAQRAGGALIPLKSEGILARVVNALAAFAGYLGKLFWPQDLTVLYLRGEMLPFGLAVCGAGLLVVTGVIAFVNLRHRPYLATGWVWFVVMLLPVIGLVQVGLQFIADRYTYLPAIGLSLVIAWGAHELTARFPVRARRWLVAVPAGAALLVCAVLTREQLGVWQNTQTLMGQALRVDPNNYVAHQNLGVYYTRLGRIEVARYHRQRVRELDPARQRAAVPATNSAPPRLDGGPPQQTSRRDG